MFQISESFCPCQAFPALSNVYGQGRSLPKWNTLKGRLLALASNIKIGQKDLIVTNNILEPFVIYNCKCFV